MQVISGGGLPVQGKIFVPELHDLYPGMQFELDEMLGVLPDHARDRTALLVVPDWQGRFALADHPGFVARLRQLRGDLVLHGYHHSLGEDWWNRFWYGHDNRSECRNLDAAQAGALVARGLEVLQQTLGVKPHWFCAPRWQQSAAFALILQQAGFRGYFTVRSVELIGQGRVMLPALNFDEGDRAWRNAIARPLRQRRIGALIRAAKPFRLVLHPADVRDRATWRQVQDCVRRLADEGWQSQSLSEAFPSTRSAAEQAG